MVACGISGLFGGRFAVLLFADNILIVPVFALAVGASLWFGFAVVVFFVPVVFVVFAMIVISFFFSAATMVAVSFI
jgi:hypothetical protein